MRPIAWHGDIHPISGQSGLPSDEKGCAGCFYFASWVYWRPGTQAPRSRSWVKPFTIEIARRLTLGPSLSVVNHHERSGIFPSFVHPNVCSTQDASARPGRQTGRIKHRPGLAAILDEGKRWGISLVCPSRLGRSAFFRQTTQNLGLFRGFTRNLTMNRSYCIRAVDQSGEKRPLIEPAQGWFKNHA